MSLFSLAFCDTVWKVLHPGQAKKWLCDQSPAALRVSAEQISRQPAAGLGHTALTISRLHAD